MDKPHFRAPFVTLLATSALLGASSCKNADSPTATPPAGSQQVPPDEYGNPPGPDPEPTASAAEDGNGLPKWGDIKSSHPEGATNPPSPILTLTRTGACLKSFEGGIGGAPRDTKFETFGERRYYVRLVADREAAKKWRTTVVQCPAGAKEFLATQKAPAASASPPQILRNPPRPLLPPKPRPRGNPPGPHAPGSGAKN